LFELLVSFGEAFEEADAASCKLDKSPKSIGIEMDVVEEDGPETPVGAVPNT
jgi:hypothetical protein